MKNKKYIEDHTLRCEVSYRGGGIEIDISELIGVDDARMSAYQNYLGGGDEYMQENVTGKDAKGGYEFLQGLSASAY